MKRPSPSIESALATLGVIVAVGVLLSILTVVPSGNGGPVATAGPQTSVAPDTQPGTSNGTAPGTNPSKPGGNGAGKAPAGPSTAPSSGGNPAAQPSPTSQAGLQCAPGKNGGSTAPGVTATQIVMGATTVTDGVGSSFLGQTVEAMQAVVNQVNRAGGICGRQLNVEMRNDSWSESLGKSYIEDLVNANHVFGLAVNPDSEGLYGADKFIRQNQIPVVGTEGQLIHEYQNPWIWPVGTSTISQMHIMARDAYNRGARNFSIVFDAQYRFGVEGAYAFDQAVKRLTGHDIPGYNTSGNCVQRYCGIPPTLPSYASDAQQFSSACASRPYCDFTAYLLEPNVAVNFLSSSGNGGISPQFGDAGAEPLFDRQAFAAQCAQCAGEYRWDVWTSFQPPEGSYVGQPAEAAYVRLMRGYDSNLDVDNQFTEGAYIGMNLLVTALRKVGPDLTRTRLQYVLDHMTYRSGLTKPLTYTAANHFANTAAMAWRLHYSNGQFAGFSPDTGFETDRWYNQDLTVPGQ